MAKQKTEDQCGVGRVGLEQEAKAEPKTMVSMTMTGQAESSGTISLAMTRLAEGSKTTSMVATGLTPQIEESSKTKEPENSPGGGIRTQDTQNTTVICWWAAHEAISTDRIRHTSARSIDGHLIYHILREQVKASI